MPCMPTARADALSADAEQRLARLLSLTDAHADASVGAAWHARRVTDVLAHLHAWHRLLLDCLAQDAAGLVPQFPAPGYGWDRLASLNDALYEAHRDASYDQVRTLVVASHDTLLGTIVSLPAEVLVDPWAFAWLGGEALGDVAHECLGAHYDWALGILAEAGLT